MAVVMGLGSRAYTYGAKAWGYVSRAVGVNNAAARRLASANRNVLNGSSIDILRAIKREVSPKYWKLFKQEYFLNNTKFAEATRNMGVLQKENWAANALAKDFNIPANDWMGFLRGLISKGKLKQNSTYRDFAKAIIRD